MTLDDLPFAPPDSASNLGAPAPRNACPHPRPNRVSLPGGSYECGRCRRVITPEIVSRGRRSRSRGNALERWVCALLGIARRGQYGGPDDGGGEADWITIQVKSGGAYPARIDSLIRSLPARSDQLRAVVHVTADGAGHSRRALITLDLREFAAWYGGRG